MATRTESIAETLSKNNVNVVVVTDMNAEETYVFLVADGGDSVLEDYAADRFNDLKNFNPAAAVKFCRKEGYDTYYLKEGVLVVS